MVYYCLLPMKRSREEEDHFDTIKTMANCLMLLSRGPGSESRVDSASHDHRYFECKTCCRRFPSFQALGGHRASHKKPKLIAGSSSEIPEISSPPKPKTHECSICGQEFTIGQALGGHMRRHRAAAGIEDRRSLTRLPVLKKTNSRRVLCLDLNLTPLENHDLEFRLGKVAPTF